MNESRLAHIILSGKEEAFKQGKTPCFSYDRVSSKKQGEKGESLNDQSDRSHIYELKNNLYIIHTFSCVESAFREGRKNFNEMLDLAIKYDIKDVIFKNTDRLGRNDYDWPRCKRMAKTKGLRVHLYELNMIYSNRSTAEEEMILDQSSSLAVYWSNKISKSVQAAYAHKVSKGIAPFNNKIFGYIYDNHNKIYIKDPERKHIIEFIFDTYDNERISIRELTKLLNERGFKNFNGNKWKHQTLHSMISNPFYAGKFIYHGKVMDGTHEPYFTWEEYGKRRERMKVKYMGARKRDYDFLFSKLFLRHKGSALTGEIKKGKYIYYTNRSANKSIREEWVFEQIDKEISKINFDEYIINGLLSMLKGAIKIKEKSHIQDKTIITKRINDLERENDKLVDSLLRGFDQATIQRRMEDNRKQIEHLEADRQKLRINKDDFMLETAGVLNDIRELPHTYEFASPAEKAELLREMAEYIVVKEASVDVKWKEPYCYIINESIMQIADTLSSKQIYTDNIDVRKCLSMLPRQDNFRTIINETVDKLNSYYCRVA